jgi:hypothetical protein
MTMLNGGEAADSYPGISPKNNPPMLNVRALEHRLVGLADQVRPGVLGRHEELQRSHVHRMFA